MDKSLSNASADSALFPDPALAKNLIPDYSEDEVLYLGELQKKLDNARNLRDTNHDEYDGMTFLESWQAEQRAANTARGG